MVNFHPCQIRVQLLVSGFISFCLCSVLVVFGALHLVIVDHAISYDSSGDLRMGGSGHSGGSGVQLLI